MQTYAAGGALLCIIVVALVFFSLSEEKQDAFFSNALEDANVVEEVRFGGRAYVVSGADVRQNGSDVSGLERVRAMQLAYEKTLARHQPLVAIPGVPLDEFERGIEKLRALQSTFANMQSNERDKRMVRESLYPVDFLIQLSTLERLRLAFLASGSEEDGRAYADYQRSVIETYLAFLSGYESAFLQVVPEDIGDYAVPSTILSRSGTLDALASLRSGMRGVRAEMLRRASCVRGAIGACKTEDLQLPEVPVPDVALPSERQQDIADAIVETLPRVPFSFDTKLGSRLILLSKSSCVTRDQDGARLFLMLRMFPGTQEEQLSATYVGNWYMFFVRQGSAAAALPFLESFARKGIEYVPMRPLIYYECPEADNDLGLLFAIREVVLFSGEYSISRYASGEPREALASLERKLSSDKIIVESDVAAYLNESLAILRDPSAPKEVKANISELVLQYVYRSLGLFGTVQSIATAEEANLGLKERGERMDFSALNLFYARSALPALLLAANPSAGGPHRLYEPNTLAAGEQPYVLLSRIAERPSEMSAVLLTSLRSYGQLYERI